MCPKSVTPVDRIWCVLSFSTGTRVSSHHRSVPHPQLSYRSAPLTKLIVRHLSRTVIIGPIVALTEPILPLREICFILFFRIHLRALCPHVTHGILTAHPRPLSRLINSMLYFIP